MNKRKYRFKRRNGIYYVLFRDDEQHPISTGQRDEYDAVVWAE